VIVSGEYGPVGGSVQIYHCTQPMEIDMNIGTPYTSITLYSAAFMDKPSKLQSRALQSEDENVRNIGQGEARHRKYKRLKLGGGQAYDRSSD
jgi:hypothetical protein